MSKQGAALRTAYEDDFADEPRAPVDPIAPGKRTATQDTRRRGPTAIEPRVAALRDRHVPALRAAIASQDLDAARSAARLVRILLAQLGSSDDVAAIRADAEAALELAPPEVEADDAVDESNRDAWVQRLATTADVSAETHTHAKAGVSGSGGTLPHLDAIQSSFGAHDVSGIRAHVGGAAVHASAAIGAEAYATGNDVAFASSPSLFVAAHEAAHVIQQRAGVSLLGGVGEVGDTYEQHADAVAEKVVRGESAEELLRAPAGAHTSAVVQRKDRCEPGDGEPAAPKRAAVLEAMPTSIFVSAEVGSMASSQINIWNRGLGPIQVLSVACRVDGVVASMAGNAAAMSGTTIDGTSPGSLHVRYTPTYAVDISSIVVVVTTNDRLEIPIHVVGRAAAVADAGHADPVADAPVTKPVPTSDFMYTPGLPSSRGPLDRAGAAVEAAARELDNLESAYLPNAKSAYAAREFQKARATSNVVRGSFDRAEARLRDARDGVLQIGVFEREGLLDAIDLVDAKVAELRPDVEDLERLAPTPVPPSMDCDDSMLICQEMNATFEADEQQRENGWNASLDAERDAQRDQQSGKADNHDKEIRGIQLFILAKHKLPKWFGMANHLPVGPRGKVGPYWIMACTVDEKILFFQAIHTKRHQSEWVIGTDALDAFVSSVDLYAGSARASLPGSSNVDDSQEDGTETAAHLPSMLELEAFGVAPHQQTFSLYDLPKDGMDKGNGGSALVSARNMHIRLEEYTKEAERLARRLKAQMDSGEIAHDVARTEAVEGRNELMRQVRAKLSPAGRMTSQKIKTDNGTSLEKMTTKKTGDVLTASVEPKTHAMDKLIGVEGSTADLRILLAEDSALWEQYRIALEAGDDVKRVFSAAVQDLGAQPVVSRAVVNSAGKSNPVVTGVAKAGRVLAAAAAVYGVYDMVATIWNAKEGETLHVAGAEFGGFAGGIIGAEVGAMSALWAASLIVPNPSTPAVLVISIFGGMAGAVAGAESGHMVGGPLADSIMNPGKAMQAGLAPGAAQNGSYAGLYERSQRMGKGEGNLNFMLANALWEMDEALEKVEKQIANAADRNKLETYQLMRLEILENRDQLGFVYSALQSGQLTEAEVWQAISGQPDAPN